METQDLPETKLDKAAANVVTSLQSLNRDIYEIEFNTSRHGGSENGSLSVVVHKFGGREETYQVNDVLSFEDEVNMCYEDLELLNDGPGVDTGFLAFTAYEITLKKYLREANGGSFTAARNPYSPYGCQ